MSNSSDHSSTESPTKLALRKIRELKQRLAEAEGQAYDDIAIVSMACRFPRRSSSPEAFWDSLAQGTDEIGEIPPQRWDIEAFFDADPETPGRMYTRRGAFLESIDQMDADFFGISPREATWIDPQQRVLLEVAWEALERAGWSPDVVGRQTGVFVGWMHNDYQNESSDSLLNLNPYVATGSAGSFLCGRLSYQLGLEGPSVAVDSACSSSLVAVHLACQSLQRRECDRALVGGVNIMASPKTAVLTCKLKALSPGGNSRAFDARADGYVRGEGCGMVALRRLADAQRDGDSILAVIRGSAITHNGSGSGLTVPNPEAQQRVIRQCLRNAGVEPSRIDYLEAHGTGTELGDPIEMQAAAAVLGADRDPDRPLLVGSVKTNIGHLEAAAGIAGLIKTVLSLGHDIIPPHLHFEQPNPHIPWDEIPVQVVSQPTPWPREGTRVAGISAFGMSGTNAYAIVESAPAAEAVSSPAKSASQRLGRLSQPAAGQPVHRLLVLSGKVDQAVRELAGRYGEYLKDHPETDLADLCYTTLTGRRHFERRAALVVDSVEQTQALLDPLQRGASADGLVVGGARGQPKVAWQFTGQGSQYPGMARGLYQTHAVFRQTLDRCDQALRQWRDGSLLEVMFGDESRLNQTTWTQPALFALEMGLSDLLMSWGLRPDIVLGHSVGQFAAACVAGMMEIEDGLRLITERSRLTGALPAGGAMAAVFASPDKVQQSIASHVDLSIAALNGPHTVISGPERSVVAAIEQFQDQGIRTKRLTTSHAFHSALMEPAMDELQQVADSIEFRRAALPLVCNVSGQILDADTVLDGAYWKRHLREPVQYSASIDALKAFGCDAVVELGPQPVLTSLAAACWSAGPPALVGTLDRNADDTQTLLAAVAQLYVAGASPSYAALDRSVSGDSASTDSGRAVGRRRLMLPTYPFQRQRYWGPAKPDVGQAERDSAHPLLGARRQLAGITGEQRYENHLAADNPRWLDDHKVFDDVVFPGAGYLEMALAASGETCTLHDVVFEMPLRLSKPTCVQSIVRPSGPSDSAADEITPTWKIEIHSTPERSDHWTRNFAAEVSSGAGPGGTVDLAELARRCHEEIDVAEFYESVHGMGLHYGSEFQTIRQLGSGDGEVLARLQTSGDMLGYVIPPTLMDGAFQSLAVGLLRDADSSFYLPVGMESLECFGRVTGDVWSHARWRPSEGDVRTADLTLLDDRGAVLAHIEKLRLRPVRRAALRQLAGAGPERLVYELAWHSATLESSDDKPSHWIIVRDESQAEHAESLARSLGQRQQQCLDVQLRDDMVDARLDPASCVISGSDPGQWTAAIKQLAASDGQPALDGVIWMAGTLESSAFGSLADRTRSVCSSMLGLLRSLREQRLEQLPRGLQIITHRGASIDSGESVAPEIGQFWGLGRVISAEYPGLRCRLVDVDDESRSEAYLVDLLLTESHENQLALRAGHAHVPRLVPKKSGPLDEFSVDPEGSYLITGGLGMLGRQAARWLARQGATSVVLVSRREPTDSTREIIAEIEDQGCRVHVHLADISRREDLVKLMRRFDGQLPPLKGVIHASGVLDDGLMAEQTWSRFEPVLAPKQSGALLLDELTRDLPLDFFVLYSSAASVLGSPGQGNYATANAFLDGLAQQRAAAGLPALSVNWGPWNEGMAASDTVVRSLALQGLTALTSDESHQVLEQLIVSKAVQATVLDVDWRRMRKRLSAFALPVLDVVMPDPALASPGDSALVEKLRSLEETERSKLLTTHVQQELQQILSLAQPPDPETPLAELGLDSLMAVELSTRLQQQMEPEITISPTVAFDYPSGGALTEHLLSLFKELPEPVVPAKVDVHVDRDEVAIIGLGCRFPGAADADQFWRNLCDGVDATCDLPGDRWNVDQYYSPTPTAGKMYTRRGGFLESIGDFDAEFFGISGQEACWMDPQHRLLMEVSWEAMESASFVPRGNERRVGVFMGIMHQDYAQLQVDDPAAAIDGFRGAGLAPSAGVGRISYLLGFEGPSMAIDSASSSSLVAVCQAVKSLLGGECNLALAGGVNAILTPTNSLLLCKAGMLAPDGRCKSFSAAADGFGRGEGCGVVVLKRLRDAQRDGDTIMAVIRGSAISHNGFSGGLTAPSGRSQERVIRQALDDARMAPTEIDYLEAHGTGTELGDPIELTAASAVLGKGRTADHPLLVGSVKANIGHLEAAGGVSGLIKAVLSMHHGLIPRQIHFDEPSPHIPWDRIPVKIVTEPTPWPRAEARTASVSALGMSGTNAHVVLEARPQDRHRGNDKSDNAAARSQHLLVLSAKSLPRLRRLAGRYADRFAQLSCDAKTETLPLGAADDLANACYTAAVGRNHWVHRAAMVIPSAQQASELLRSLEAGRETAGLIQAEATKSPRIGWMFTGSGSHYLGMARTLYQTQRVFRDVIDRYADQLWQDREGSLTEAMFGDPSLLAQPVWNQPALFALQAALVELWHSWGVQPDILLGDGVGQYAAACVAGVMSWDDGLRLVAERSRLLQTVDKAVSVVDSGQTPAAAKPGNVDPGVLDQFEAFADTIDYFPADRPLICSLSGDVVPVHRLLGGSYWRRHLCEPSDLASGAATLAEQDCDLLLEVGPQPNLIGQLGQHWPQPAGPCFVPSLREGEDDERTMLLALGEFYVRGLLPDFKAFDEPWQRQKVQLPSQPFVRSRFWITDVAKFSEPASHH